MTQLRTNNFVFLMVLFLIFYSTNFVFSQNNMIKQDPKFEQLLKEKRKINSGIVTNNRFKIQIFSGNNELSKKALADFKKEFKEFDATIVFNTPNYKVWVGNYKTRIEGEKNLKIILKKYPNALLIKPSK